MITCLALSEAVMLFEFLIRYSVVQQHIPVLDVSFTDTLNMRVE